MSTNISAPGSANTNPACYQLRDLIYGVAGIFHPDDFQLVHFPGAMAYVNTPVQR
jgi:hypothetical protein